jgi:hypothetical protein
MRSSGLGFVLAGAVPPIEARVEVRTELANVTWPGALQAHLDAPGSRTHDHEQFPCQVI